MKGYHTGTKGLYRRRPISDKHEHEMPALVAQGLSNYQIAALWGCGRDAVRKLRKKLGLPGRTVKQNLAYTQTDVAKETFLDDGRFERKLTELGLPKDCFAPSWPPKE